MKKKNLIKIVDVRRVIKSQKNLL